MVEQVHSVRHRTPIVLILFPKGSSCLAPYPSMMQMVPRGMGGGLGRLPSFQPRGLEGTPGCPSDD